MLTTEDRSYLNNKHRGGANNFKGDCYENYYSVYKIALLLKHFPLNDITKISAQVADSFVDDICISHKQGQVEFYQIKNVKSLTWQSGSSHTIEYDFCKQKEKMLDEKTPFTLFLVYSDRQSDITKIPDCITDCTKTDFFPYFPSMNRLLFESTSFRNAISEISASQDLSIDILEKLSIILLGLWSALEKDDVSLNELVTKLRAFNSVGHNFIFDLVLQISNFAKDIYDRIPFFSYMTIGSTFYWSYKHIMKGEMYSPSYLNFEKAVIRSVPKSFDELEVLMIL